MGEATRNSDNSMRRQFHPYILPYEKARACRALAPHLDSLVARGNSGTRRVPPRLSGAKGRGRGLGAAGVGEQGGRWS